MRDLAIRGLALMGRELTISYIFLTELSNPNFIFSDISTSESPIDSSMISSSFLDFLKQQQSHLPQISTHFGFFVTP
jgi:hypothetical protein